jgi:cobalt-zinc-cadmium efflux system outer membrane protein
MRDHVLRWGFVLVLLGMVAIREASAQGPTVDTGLPPAPGSSASTMGVAPGAGGGTLDNPGSNTPMLGGRPGATTPHVPSSVANPGLAGSPTALQMGIAAPAPTPSPTPPLFGSVSLPQALDYEGPPQGMTLDDAIDRLLSENLDLRGKYFEIPQAQADVLQAGLRANPVFYADGQLIPYGQFSRSSPGGPTQYDVNVSYPFDVSHKRQARTLVATRAKRVLEAQYQDAVRGSIDNLYQAFVDVLAARQTVIYSKASFEGLEKLWNVERKRYELGQSTRADVGRVEIQRDTAQISLLDAEESQRKTKRAFAILLNIPPVQADALELRGGITDRFPPPPPLDVLNQIALTVRPDIVSYRLGISRAEADVKLALANRFTDVYVLYQPYTFQNNQPYGLKSPMSWALGVTVPIPIYNRNQGAIQRAKLNVTQTQIQLMTLEHQAVTDVAQAYREYELTRKMVDTLRSTLLPRAAQVLADSYRLYVGGEKDVTFYLLAQKDYNDTIKQFLDTMVRHRRSMLSLNTVLGQRVLP